MVWTLLALAGRGVASTPQDPAAAMFSFVTSIVLSAGVGWWAHRLARARTERLLAELTEATPVGGVH
jgi:hypothetical protein